MYVGIFGTARPEEVLGVINGAGPKSYQPDEVDDWRRPLELDDSGHNGQRGSLDDWRLADVLMDTDCCWAGGGVSLAAGALGAVFEEVLIVRGAP